MNSYLIFLWLRFLTASWQVSPELPPGTEPETTEERTARVEMIWAAVAFEASEQADSSPFDAKTLATAAGTVVYRESRFAKSIHAGHRGRWGSDNGRARCLSQIHASGIVPLSEWQVTAGTSAEATRRCVRATMRVLSAMARYCSTTDLDVVLSAYATGRGCRVIPLGRRRAKMAYGLLARL